jgi:hypothetical protein
VASSRTSTRARRSRVDPATIVKGASAEREVTRFVAKFDSRVARLIRSTRQAVRKLMPTANELVYDNYNFFVIGFSSTERPSDALVSLACSAKGVSLCFIYGATLPDPDGILQGGGNQTRFVRLESAATLAEPPVVALIRAAKAQADPPLRSTGRRVTIVRSVSAKQRARRAASTGRRPRARPTG